MDLTGTPAIALHNASLNPNNMKYIIMLIVMSAISIGHADSPSMRDYSYTPAFTSGWRWKNFDDCKLIYRFSNTEVDYSCSGENHDHSDFLNSIAGNVVQRSFIN